MKSFFIGLQFLTRISLVKQEVWTEKDFGESVKFFPAVGAILGIFYSFFVGGLFFFTGGNIPIFVGATAFFLFVALTGGIHFDGLSDTSDGLFSGREREKILEIMKDSRVGSFGALSLISVALLDVSTLSELAKISCSWLCASVYCAPIIGRFAMVFSIGFFPYARASGMGKAFAEHTTRRTILFAGVTAILILSALIFVDVKIFLAGILALIISLGFTFYFGNFATKKIGGVTGDIYGAASTLVELIVPIIFLLCKIY